jgi:hypothetical protein
MENRQLLALDAKASFGDVTAARGTNSSGNNS